ncbi:SRPBCC family protein [Virgibacillus sp. NKC19-16]|uniref:CoxG family protein n=1 Tax=Virgibacillus salidurans TaxID=2831673 RepID=UPI001F1A8E5E|nr:SRPBCC family protein [Virgibacillus sp. NKC19-16]UJL45479.1 SRPBCC family protein [Virgibacillus sp. NKC19-16]
MPSGMHQIELDIPIENVWSFVSDMDNWAPLVPGYMNHEMISDRQSTWTFKGNLGVMEKIVSLKIDITEWQAPTKVTFNLTGVDENFTGDGYFEANDVNGRQTKMTGYLDITAKGMMGPMINPVLKTLVPKKGKQLTEAIGRRMRAMETVAT